MFFESAYPAIKTSFLGFVTFIPFFIHGRTFKLEQLIECDSREEKNEK